MNLKLLSNPQLHKSLQNHSSREREILSIIVEHIHEVERRKLYLDYGHSCLFDYLVDEMKYSNGSAQRRIDAARLLGSVATLTEDIKTGDISLNQITVIAQALKQAKKEGHAPSTAEVKKELVEKVKAQPTFEAQKLVAQTLNLEIKTVEKKVMQKDESLRVEMTLTKKEQEEISSVKDLVSHTHPGASIKEIFMLGLAALKKQKDPAEKQKRIDQRKQRAASKSTSTVEVKSRAKSSKPAVTAVTPPRPPSKAQLYREVQLRQRACQWTHSNGRKCGSTFQLQVDHKHSKWLGGTDDRDNLQMLCGIHNRLKYEQEIGLRH